MLIPLRHCRKHIGSTWLALAVMTDGSTMNDGEVIVVKMLMGMVEDYVSGQGLHVRQALEQRHFEFLVHAI